MIILSLYHFLFSDSFTNRYFFIFICLYLLIGIVFFVKGKLTRKSIEEQEIAILKIHKDDFLEIAESMVSNNVNSSLNN